MKLSQKLQMDVVSNQTKPFQTIANQTNSKSSLKQPKQSDIDETFTEPSDRYGFKPYNTKPNQL